MKTILPLLILLIPAITCQKSVTQSVSEPGELTFVESYPNLEFRRPVDFQSPKDGTNRVFVVEQKGVISVFENNKDISERSTFLDIQSAVDDSGNEEGLLGLAFHPNFTTNGYFYVNYTSANNETIVSRFQISKNDPNKADTQSEQIILRFNQPYSNHNGGQVCFGPDGYLYISTGDGGSGGDPQGNGQNLSTLLGAILRIDVDKSQGNLKYGIPADNPFLNVSNARPEIYAYGLRNPWRISFDSENGMLWAADVGQNAFEEVDIIVKGGNYGWNDMEGLHSYKSGSNSSNYLPPVLEIAQSTGDKSITGGFVYRGTKAPSLIGKYVFADYVSGRIYALAKSTDGSYQNETLFDTKLNIAAFGEDEDHELYFCAFDGKVYHFEE